MIPLTLLAAQKLAAVLTEDDALQVQVLTAANAAGVAVPAIARAQVLVSAVTPAMGDRNLQLIYPRICIYPGILKNTLVEKFRSFSGQVDLIAEIWASGDLIDHVDQSIHFYTQGLASVLQRNRGDWDDGIFFAGEYQITFQPPKAGGLGFVESAKVTLSLHASLS